jgi:hypothetical protein
MSFTRKKTDEPFQIKGDDVLIAAAPLNDEQTEFNIVVSNRTKQYETPYARIGAFITSKCREEMSSLIQPHLENIVMCQTDGFISTTKLDIETGTELGSLRYEGLCEDCEIINGVTRTKNEFFVK